MSEDLGQGSGDVVSFGRGDKCIAMYYLQLVLAGLSGWAWVEKIDGQNLTILSVLHVQMKNCRRPRADR